MNVSLTRFYERRSRVDKKSPREIYKRRAAQSDYFPLHDMPEYLLSIAIAFEDPYFYVHKGIDLRSIWKSITGTFQGKQLRGASTIPQQLVKNLYFTFDRSWIRKLREAFLALRFSRHLTKDEILELYLNTIYYDNGQYGITNAGRFYFSKTPAELTVNQSVFLMNILPIAGIRNPLYHPRAFVEFRDKKIREISDILNGISEDIIPEVRRHGPQCLDEELTIPSEDTKKYDAPGPMINERFGPGQIESLIRADE